MPPPAWSRSVAFARHAMTQNLFTSNSCSLELQSTWMAYESALLLDVKLDYSHRVQELDRYRIGQIEHCEAVQASLCKRWYPAVLQTFLSPPPDERLAELVGARDNLFHAVGVLMSRQLRGLVESTCDALAKFFEMFAAVEADEMLLAMMGKSEVKIMPAFYVKLTVNGSHIRVIPSLEEMDASLGSMLDRAVEAVDGFPHLLTSALPAYSPFSDAAAAGTAGEVQASLEKVQADSVAISAQLFSSAEGGTGCLRVARVEEDSFIRTKERIRAVLTANFAGPRRIVEHYEKFVQEYYNLLSLDPYKLGEEYRAAKHSLDRYKVDIEKFRKAAEDVLEVTVNDVNMGIFAVQTEPVKRGITTKALLMADILLTQVLAENVEEMSDTCMRFDIMHSRAMEKPKESQEMKALKAYLEATPKELALLRAKILNIAKRTNFLHSLNKEIPEDDVTLCTKTYMWPDKIQPVLDAAMERVLSQEERMEDSLRARQKKFDEEVKETTNVLKSFYECGEPRQVNLYVQGAAKLRQELEGMSEELQLINEQEEIFGWNPTVNPLVDENLRLLEPFEVLFKLSAETQRNIYAWTHGPILELDPEKVESEVDNLWRASYKMMKQYADYPQLLKLCEAMRSDVGAFKPNVQLISIFCNGGLRDRHWNQMANVVGLSIKPTEKTSVADLVERKLEPYLNKLEEISDSASKEWSLEKNLNKQLSEWDQAFFDMKPYRDTGTSILSGSCVDEIQTILDDQIVKTQTMIASPYIKPHEVRAKEWESFLLITQDVIDIWLKVQAQWLYLEPIFASDDIKKQMPKEAEGFAQVDFVFRNTVAKCLENPKVLIFTRTEGLLSNLQGSFELLEKINKGLNEYLEQKRLYFPRFFFLSNDELLEILSETKDPMRVQPHLKKCFEAIAKLDFDENFIIQGMISSETEKVPWPRPLNPADARGAVERWLVDTEIIMREAVRDQTMKARIAYPETDREKWVLDWPGMTVICVGQMFWTSEVEQAIAEPGGDGVKDYAQKCTDQLDDVVDLVRGTLTKLQRSSIGALVVLDVHARDMTVNLAEEGVSSVLDFSWLAQLRYYWEDDNVSCKMITACLKYGYEYLGVSSRLVVTPLTDRCYRTLMGALQLNLGGAPEGPAGTGKTETTKDLAKAIANYCVVFNCSDGLDYLAMGKFFKGLASCGAWACFDEFNRIDLEVLSVIAQQIMGIQRAIQLHMTEFDFEGSHLRLNPACSVFITMNPVC